MRNVYITRAIVLTACNTAHPRASETRSRKENDVLVAQYKELDGSYVEQMIRTIHDRCAFASDHQPSFKTAVERDSKSRLQKPVPRSAECSVRYSIKTVQYRY